ncbi:MAG: phosphate propanoyltransferase [Propionibacteriaceae bacterium]|nr:phosphate propanoyltransferase [Propionibacteriaceae bacterium]
MSAEPADGRADQLVDRVVDKVVELLRRPWVEVEASGRHVHVCRATADRLFGVGAALEPVADLSQPGQFVSRQRIQLIGPKGQFSAVVILGPERSKTQVEISATDALTLGIEAPVRLSGDLAGTPGVVLVGPAGRVELDGGVIIARRHIHMRPDFARRHGLADRQAVSVRVWGERGLTFDQVIVRVSPDFATFMHIDYDEANACGFRPRMTGCVLV